MRHYPLLLLLWILVEAHGLDAKDVSRRTKRTSNYRGGRGRSPYDSGSAFPTYGTERWNNIGGGGVPVGDSGPPGNANAFSSNSDWDRYSIGSGIWDNTGEDILSGTRRSEDESARRNNWEDNFAVFGNSRWNNIFGGGTGPAGGATRNNAGDTTRNTAGGTRNTAGETRNTAGDETRGTGTEERENSGAEEGENAEDEESENAENDENDNAEDDESANDQDVGNENDQDVGNENAETGGSENSETEESQNAAAEVNQNSAADSNENAETEESQDAEAAEARNDGPQNAEEERRGSYDNDNNWGKYFTGFGSREQASVAQGSGYAEGEDISIGSARSGDVGGSGISVRNGVASGHGEAKID